MSCWSSPSCATGARTRSRACRAACAAGALLNDPDILLLDEPTTGLDPQARHLLWERLHELRDRGVTLVLTTHYMDEAEQLCDRIAVMDNGRFAAQGRPSDLIAAHAAREVLELRYPEGERDDAVAEIADEVPSALVDRIEVLSDRLLIYTSDADKLLATVLNGRHQPRGSLVRRGSLEDVFLALTGRNLVD
jgi:lipooligosaccharide transport system ATP-binding protein